MRTPYVRRLTPEQKREGEEALAQLSPEEREALTQKLRDVAKSLNFKEVK